MTIRLGAALYAAFFYFRGGGRGGGQRCHIYPVGMMPTSGDHREADWSRLLLIRLIIGGKRLDERFY